MEGCLKNLKNSGTTLMAGYLENFLKDFPKPYLKKKIEELLDEFLKIFLRNRRIPWRKFPNDFFGVIPGETSDRCGTNLWMIHRKPLGEQNERSLIIP